MRLVSLAMGLGLVVVLMQIARSPGTIERLGLLFGEAAPTPVLDDSDASPAPLPGIDSALLGTIEDNTTFRDEESPAWFHLLALARDASPEQLAAGSVGELAYAQLVNQPDVYRGKPVHLDGHARRVEAITPAENDMGITQLYRVIMQPSRDVLRPLTLYCLELPDGWTMEEELPNDGRLSCDALFFKNWVFNNARGVDLSPVFLSNSFTPIAAPVQLVDRTPAISIWQTIGLAMLAAGILVAFIALRGSDTPRHRYAVDNEQLSDELMQLASDSQQPEK